MRIPSGHWGKKKKKICMSSKRRKIRLVKMNKDQRHIQLFNIGI